MAVRIDLIIGDTEEVITGSNDAETIRTAVDRIFNVKYGNSLLKESESRRLRNNIRKDVLLQVNTQLNDVFEKRHKLLSSPFLTIDVWQVLEERIPKSFTDVKPVPRPLPLKPSEIETPPKPEFEKVYNTSKSILDFIFPKRYEKRIQKLEIDFHELLQNWKLECSNIENKNKEKFKSFIEETENTILKNETEEKNWLLSKHEFEKSLKNSNDELTNMKDAFSKRIKEGIEFYFNNIIFQLLGTLDVGKLKSASYFQESTKILLVECELPNSDSIHNIDSFKYVTTRDSYEAKMMTTAKYAEYYDNVLYQIVLLIIGNIFNADGEDLLHSVALNGYVEQINKSTGNLQRTTILSLLANKEKFRELNLSEVNPRECFKSFKGVSASSLSSIAAIQPLIAFNKEDSRFVEGREVLGEMSQKQNLATMDWEDFEHLVREIFEKEFRQNGGEVKVTQASRDGGVDAVAFDPDPIRGGKIVIQAKRYSNTVGVSAIRDLYGTVLNEGATKGILVTTSDFGPDAYEFAKDKPITLLSGSNLLFLLEKHGIIAKIDLAEAKALNQNK